MRVRSSSPPFWWRIATYGFLLNMLWEFGQCLFLYGMWDWGFWRASVWMWGATFGDVLIVLGVTALARLTVGPAALASMNGRAWVSLLGIGLVASIGLEWAARALGLWEYSAWMPTITLLGHTVGLSPIVQVTILPALSVAFAQRRRQESPGS